MFDRPRKVVCAANKHKETGIVTIGARHFDSWMMQQIDRLVEQHKGQIDFTPTTWECGFIDNKDNYLTRNEAYDVAVFNGQVSNGDSGWFFVEPVDPVLISEDLY